MMGDGLIATEYFTWHHFATKNSGLRADFNFLLSPIDKSFCGSVVGTSFHVMILLFVSV